MPLFDSISPPQPVGSSLPLQGKTLLLVEDSRFTADELRLMVLRGGAQLRRTQTLTEARRHLSLYRPDAVLIDLGLPDGSGLNLIRELATNLPGRPVVFAISGDPSLRSAALSCGAADFWEKPLPGCDDFLKCLSGALLRQNSPSGLFSQAKRPDCLALEEDLRFAQSLLTSGQGREDRLYIAGFLTGLARASADPELALAAAKYNQGSDQAGHNLAALLAQRLAGQPPPFG